jgi:hypothetical protein
MASVLLHYEQALAVLLASEPHQYAMTAGASNQNG